MASGSTGRTVGREQRGTGGYPMADDQHPNETSNVWPAGEMTAGSPELPPWLGDSRPLPVVVAPKATTGEIPRVPAGHRLQADGKRRRRHRRKRMPLSPRRRRIRWIRRVLLALIAIALVLVGTSVTKAMLVPGNASVEARLAEWGRNHHLGRAVTWLENYEYKRHPPKVGGQLSHDDLQQLEPPATPPPVRATVLKPIQPFLVDPAPHEGEWTPTVVSDGVPIIEVAKLRSDPDHTAYLSAVAWINQKYSRFVLHPGSQEPGGGGWAESDHLTQADRPGLIATWNGGFRLTNGDAKGGFYLDGKSYGTLRPGQASEVLMRDGSLQIGEWGRDFTMTPNVVGVRQNLSLLVDNGVVNPSVDSFDTTLWGLTVDNAFFVWRSGVGITANGDIVYAMGPALSVRTLAELLRRAGAVRAMELDINSEWVSFMTYAAGPDPFGPVPTKLLPEFKRNGTRYFSTEERDFVAVYLRPGRAHPIPTRTGRPHGLPFAGPSLLPMAPPAATGPPPPPAPLPPSSTAPPGVMMPPPIR
jgi:hypothetical protein